MKVFTPATPLERCKWDSPSIFLAGSIEMDRADRWQDRIISRFSNEDVVFLNPRRDDWDNSIEQTKDDLRFRQQVLWELDMLDQADLIVMNFQPLTVSPVSLMELGLFSGSGNMVVCCPEGYFRKGNVDIVCEWMRTNTVGSFKELLEYLDNWIGECT
jgi:hypothetical protein